MFLHSLCTLIIITLDSQSIFKICIIQIYTIINSILCGFYIYLSNKNWIWWSIVTTIKILLLHNQAILIQEIAQLNTNWSWTCLFYILYLTYIRTFLTILCLNTSDTIIIMNVCNVLTVVRIYNILVRFIGFKVGIVLKWLRKRLD